MKKFLTLGIVALVLITLSGCQFNIFAAFDKIDIPSATELSDKATTDPEGLVDDVQEYVDSDSITEDNADDIVTALAIVYNNPANDVATQQEAALLAGEVAINGNPDTSAVVNGVISAVSNALSTGSTIDPDTLIAAVFEGITPGELSGILADLDQAALAYADFSANLGTDPGMTSGEIGDMAQLAVISLVVSDIKNQVGEAALIDAIINGTPLGVTNPLDTAGTSLYDDELVLILTFAGLNL